VTSWIHIPGCADHLPRKGERSSRLMSSRQMRSRVRRRPSPLAPLTTRGFGWLQLLDSALTMKTPVALAPRRGLRLIAAGIARAFLVRQDLASYWFQRQISCKNVGGGSCSACQNRLPRSLIVFLAVI
jgi:hypothetical protein